MLIDMSPCKCGSEELTIIKFNQYRPKEALVKCNQCEFQLPIKANHTSKIIRFWNAHWYSRNEWKKKLAAKKLTQEKTPKGGE